MLLKNKEAIEAINKGECGVVINQYYSEHYDKQCVSIEWTNI